MANAPPAPLIVSTLARSPLYSEALGLDLASRNDPTIFCWFLASALYGGRISEAIATRTYRAFKRHRLVTPRRILRAGWDYLVDPIMREGGYVRYDGRKSTQLLRDCDTLLADYRGSMTALHDAARDPKDLEQRLTALYGVGPVTANIFLRELRPFWRHADPEPLPIVYALARQYGIDVAHLNRKSLTFCRIEAGLIRLRKTARRGNPRRT